MSRTTIKVSDPRTRETRTIAAPWFAVGDRVRVDAPVIGSPEAVVVEVDGPSCWHHSHDRADPWMYTVAAEIDGRAARWPTKGRHLTRVPAAEGGAP